MFYLVSPVSLIALLKMVAQLARDITRAVPRLIQYSADCSPSLRSTLIMKESLSTVPYLIG